MFTLLHFLDIINWSDEPRTEAIRKIKSIKCSWSRTTFSRCKMHRLFSIKTDHKLEIILRAASDDCVLLMLKLFMSLFTLKWKIFVVEWPLNNISGIERKRFKEWLLVWERNKSYDDSTGTSYGNLWGYLSKQHLNIFDIIRTKYWFK